jgi:hypothetical protein
VLIKSFTYTRVIVRDFFILVSFTSVNNPGENKNSFIRAVPDGRGIGLFYWDAAWTAVIGNGWDSTDSQSGNAWKNQALFDFNDQALLTLTEYLHP